MSKYPRHRGNPLARFEGRIDRSGDPHPQLGTRCWIFDGFPIKGGYQQFVVGQRKILAHRWAYQQWVGDLMDGLTVDHLCRVTSCVNPQHLEQVTMLENIRRGGGAVKTHCPLGHAYDDENTYVRPDGGRDCKTCINRRSRERNQRRKAA